MVRHNPALRLLLLLFAVALIAGCAETDLGAEEDKAWATADDHVQFGERAMLDGHADMAREHFNIALGKEPDSTAAHHGLLRLHLADNEYEEAWLHFQQIERLDPALFNTLIPDAAIMLYQWALVLESSDLDDEARALFFLTWDLCQRGQFRHPEAGDLHYRLAHYYWLSDDQDDWRDALSHLHQASQATPAWTQPYLDIAGLALALDKPSESLWALFRARSLNIQSLLDLESDVRHELATSYVVRAQELFENRDLRFGGIQGDNLQEDPAEYLEAAAHLVPDYLPLHFWLARLRLSVGDLRAASVHLTRARALAEQVPGTGEDLAGWWDTYGPVLSWLEDVVGRGPFPPPVTITNQIDVQADPVVSPAAAWAPNALNLAFSSVEGLHVATPYQDASLVLRNADGFSPNGPLAWTDDATILVSVLSGRDGERAEGGPAPAGRLLQVSLDAGQVRVFGELPAGFATTEVAVHQDTGRIALLLAPIIPINNGSRAQEYALLILDAGGRELVHQNRQGLPEDLAWNSDGEALKITERPYLHAPALTTEVDLGGAQGAVWPGPGTRHPLEPLSAYGIPGTPWTEVEISSENGSQTVGRVPMSLERAPVWAPDGRFLATNLRVAPGYGIPHLLVWRSDGSLVGWMNSAHDMKWSPDGSFALWLSHEASGDIRINIGRWVGQ